jgi:site-specific recombinase XerD
MRRMVAVELLDAGVDARTVSELTGHTVQVLLTHYVRPTPDRLRQAVARLGAAPKVIDMRRRREEG